MNIAVYCSAHEGLPQAVRDDAAALGRWIGNNGHTLVYGGLDNGLMGTVASAAAESDAKIMGVVPQSRLSRRHPANTLDIMVATLHERKQTMEENAHVFVALDGGIGTIDEVMSALASTSFFDTPRPIHLLNRDGLYSPLAQMMAEMQSRGLVRPEVAARLQMHPTVDALLAALEADAAAMTFD